MDTAKRNLKKLVTDDEANKFTEGLNLGYNNKKIGSAFGAA